MATAVRNDLVQRVGTRIVSHLVESSLIGLITAVAFIFEQDCVSERDSSAFSELYCGGRNTSSEILQEEVCKIEKDWVASCLNE